MIQPFKPSTRKPANSPHLKGLQAIVVTPDEKAVVFIRSSKKGFRWFSKISVGLIERAGDYRILGNISEEETLDHHLEKPDSCDVVVSKFPESFVPYFATGTTESGLKGFLSRRSLETPLDSAFLY